MSKNTIKEANIGNFEIWIPLKMLRKNSFREFCT